MGDYKLSAGNYPASAMSENRARFDGYSSDAASADSVKANEILAGIKAAGKSKQDEARTYITTNGVLKPGVKKDSGRKATKKVGKTTRIVLDVALTLMLVFEMFIQYTGAFLHEVIGFALFATIAAHMALSAKWVKGTVQATQKGKLGGRHAALAVVGCLLAVTTVALGLSSVAISSILYSAGFVWPIGTYAAWATVHAFSAYALCALVVVHLAMHWAFLASAFKVPYDPSRRRAISTGVNVLAGLGVVALGIAAAGTMTPQVSSAAQGAGNSGGTSAGATVSSQANAMPGASDLLASDAGSAASQPAAVASEITTASSSSSSKSARKGSKGSGAASTSSTEIAGTAPGSSASNESSVSGAIAQSGSSATAGGEASSTSGQGIASVVGNCTLCRKQCPLSAPQCNKPYEAGLL